eukprot:TRINITY_DN3728_c0_g1_i6.p1 TRINITY_DN3728_c0_g1~~TRINITY_DN3728_c0_g1_i6.p1  ORF type:complete len:280 (+),score=42.71 TRINITY_DN3728_c0_g1_i6:937-1776(+)
MVPMAKVNWSLMRLLYQQPLLIVITMDYGAASSHPVLLCTYHAFSKGYTTYSLYGINIFFLNAIPVVVIRTLLLIVSLITGKHYMSPIVSFFFDLVCAVPITFFIGLSISCITIQTNYMIGALLNASFGSLTELILFSLAMRKGALNDLILYSLTGGLLNDMLLIPGLSMKQWYQRRVRGLALIFLLGSLLCYASYFAKDYGLLCYHLAKYMLFPFGKFIVHSRSLTESSLGESYYDNTEKSALFGQWRPTQRVTPPPQLLFFFLRDRPITTCFFFPVW